jgi:hypothetical protein
MLNSTQQKDPNKKKKKSMRVAQEGVQRFLYFSKNQQEMSAIFFCG